MPTLTVNGVQLFYETYETYETSETEGGGEPVLLLTGLSGVGASWGPQIPKFAREFRTIVPDHRGTGRSAVPRTGYTIAQHASDMAALLRSLEAAPAHLVGSSTGGAIAMQMALDFPDAVRSLTLVSTWARSDAYFRRLFDLRKRVMQEMGHDAAADLALLLLYSPSFLREEDETVQRLAAQMKASRPDMAAALARVDMIVAHDVLDRLQDVPHPTCIVAGTLDAITPPYFSHELQRALPHAELHLLPEAGHLVHLEKPELFYETVSRFLRSTERR